MLTLHSPFKVLRYIWISSLSHTAKEFRSTSWKDCCCSCYDDSTSPLQQFDVQAIEELIEELIEESKHEMDALPYNLG
jgi:hypothetical protein